MTHISLILLLIFAKSNGQQQEEGSGNALLVNISESDLLDNNSLVLTHVDSEAITFPDQINLGNEENNNTNINNIPEGNTSLVIEPTEIVEQYVDEYYDTENITGRNGYC